MNSQNNFNEILAAALERERNRLKPCPFCGCEARLLFRGYIDPAYVVVCTECGAEGTESKDRRKAVDNWNRRAVDESL